MPRRALVNLILFYPVLGEGVDRYSFVDSVLVTICEAGRKEERRRRRRDGPAEWAITRRPRIRFAGPRRRTHHQNPACSRRPSTGPRTASRPRDFRGRSTASRRQTPAPRKSMNRAAAGRIQQKPRPAACRITQEPAAPRLAAVLRVRTRDHRDALSTTSRDNTTAPAQRVVGLDEARIVERGKRRLLASLARRRRHLGRDDKVLITRTLAGDD